MMNLPPPESLAIRLAHAAQTILARICRQELATASKDALDAAYAAMRACTESVVDQLVNDMQTAPCCADAAFLAAALDLAEAGITSLRGPR
ncbi:hypothetical protein ACQZ32_14125 [Ralstonia pseudosolanacearum]|uniref:hypothetical protein n=2 Tax=Ralstonia pseudosolanacearum TaxID=1310165 RepID=UPI0004059A94|nr:hypothetical protein [Ralstonia pseudosolanacearum]MDN3370279.1 hypothetical protein [Ralstonia pseudosolanacearum]